MKIVKPAVAGTLESSDCQVTVESGQGEVELELTSSVISQYGEQIENVIRETLDKLAVESVKITVVDKGALDCTIRARVECAVYRANGQTGPWREIA
ncbi:citrate lyase subunit gamma (acyl carrier protein) [Lachnospiraceae bacterium PF1-21]|uniref:Citrate lyase acyl carrier protein n=1 Tax=Ohessyouella blattaphilus TaxID=2949333 RepID=A0ABT1EI91_9FIRM|nr:citrate lyase acyl carrier protein [Ohessyouella blattaphilus]MCP1110194.1 citrate lyase acyl carrier protein [Ohessyouella blattaphilus]MCR8563588.1 citrate lyase acyl carrier protein [Ohessyouella blattaphilus]MDL2251149.1 citrate lyase acyl carrier protein [Lachnospiraceae bacterium OttesenSCG-928-J05]